MYYIDEFRIKLSCMQSNIKRKIARFLIKLVGFIDPIELKQCKISKQIQVEYMKIVPNDNQWHHFSSVIDFWFKRNNKKKKSKKRITNYVDGKKVNKRKSK